MLSASITLVYMHVSLCTCLSLCMRLNTWMYCVSSRVPSPLRTASWQWSAELEVCLSACVCLFAYVGSHGQGRGQVLRSEGYRVIQDRSAFTQLDALVCMLLMYVSICMWALFIHRQYFFYVCAARAGGVSPGSMCAAQVIAYVPYDRTSVTHLKLFVYVSPGYLSCESCVCVWS